MATNGIEPQRKKDVNDYIVPIIVSLVVAFFAVHISCAYTESKANTQERIANGTAEKAEKENGFSYSEIANLFSQRMKSPTKNIYYNDSTILFVIVGELALGLFGFYMKVSKKKLITGKEYGTAEWATNTTLSSLKSGNLYHKALKKAKTPEEKAKVTAEYVEYSKDMYKQMLKKAKTEAERKAIAERWDSFRKKGVTWYKTDRIFTKTEKICMKNYELNNNTLIIGGAGAGKSRGYVLPNLLQSNTSNIVTDPKGELYGKVGYFLSKMKGHKIRILELGDFKKRSDCFNPLYYVHKEREGWEERVLTLIETLIANTDGGEKQKSSDPFWDKAERLFLQAIIFAVVQGFPEEEVNFNTVNELITWLSIEEEGDQKNSMLDCFFEDFANQYGENHIAVQQFNEFRSKASGKTAKSIVVSAVARLSSMKIPEIKRILNRDDMHLDMVGEELTTIFVVKPPTSDESNYIAGMFFTILFQELNYCATIKHREQQCVPVPVHFYLDEFATTCRIPKFVEIQSYARSLGIGITVILQSLDQLKNIYEKEWGVVLDNSNTFLYLGNVRSMETLEYVSKMLGKGTFDKQSTSRSRGKSGSSSTSYDKIGRELMTPDEINKMPKKKCLLFVSGKAPFKSDKYDYSMHPYYKYSADKDKKYFYEHTPQYMLENKQESVQSQKDIVEVHKKDTIKIEREIDRLVNENKLIFQADDEKVVQLLKDYQDVEFVDGYFPNSEDVSEETTEGMTASEVKELLQYTANKKEIELELQVESFFENELLSMSTTTEEIAATLNELNDNKDNVIDVGAEQQIQENSIVQNEITEVEYDEDEYETVSDDEFEELVYDNTSLVGKDLRNEIVSYQDDEDVS